MKVKAMGITRNIAAILIVLAAGLSLLGWGTDGFQAFTAESARRIAVLKQPKPVPDTVMVDQSGQELTFDRYKDTLLFMTFIYTRCADVCPAIERSMQEIYEALPQERLGQDIALLTVSFDPVNDTAEALHHYSQHYGADGDA